MTHHHCTGRARANKGMYNWDHPDAFDNALMERCLRSLKPSTGHNQQSLLFQAMVNQNTDVARTVSNIWLKSHTQFIQIKHIFRDIKEGRPTKIPKYDYKSNCRVPNSFTTIRPQQVLTTKYLLQLIYL